MRYGILGDIHGNLEALDAVLSSLAKEGVDRVLSVGDVVGYGADPSACIGRLRDIDAAVVAGNHDWAVVGKLDTTFFNFYAKEAVDWTASVLGRDELEWLGGLPLVRELDGLITVGHATLVDPEQFEYIQSYYDAARSINVMRTPVAVLGHSHVPLAFLMKDSLALSVATRLDLREVRRALINVGSVGQPRDENPKAAYALYDAATGSYRLNRVRYDMRSTCDKIRQAGLPGILADRLRFGR
ncbi:MAG: metallophosphoesterase family protein [Planctomycetes bacterium]|nr:metallophosphoesterase family protein [Planctomycetota bacterium]